MINFASNDQLERLLHAYGEYLSAQGKPRQSVLQYLNANRQLIQLLAEFDISSPKEITKKHLEEFQTFLYDDKDYAHASVKTYMKYVRMFFDYLVEHGHMKKNIAKTIRIQTKPSNPAKQKARYYNYDEILSKYLNHVERKVSYGYKNSVAKHIKGFFKYLRANEIKSIYSVTESTLLTYREYLWEEFVHYSKDSLVVKSQIARLRCVVRLFRYMAKEGILIENQTLNLEWEQYYKDIQEKPQTVPEMPQNKHDVTELDELKCKFLRYQRGCGKNEKTVSQYQKAVEVFYAYIDEKGIRNLAQVNKRMMSDYYIYISNYVGVRGNPASSGYKGYLLWGVKLFFRFLIRDEYLTKDPCVDLETIKIERPLPKNYLNEKEVFQLINKPRLNHDPLSYRDKAILEVLFSTAIRCNELVSLNIEDIDFYQEMLRVNNPKGGKSRQRVVPIDRTTLETVRKYLKVARPQLDNGDEKALFVSYRGHRLINDSVLNIVKKYAHQCGFRKNITTHSLRVTCATLLHKNGAPIRHIQEQLGHKLITSTQIYTRLLPLDLKSVHRRCHPLEKRASKCATL